MAQLLPSPLRYHPEDWKRSNLQHYSSAERDRASAERLRDETKRMCKAVDAQTVQTRSDVENKLSGRVRDIKFWKEELERKVEENSAETDLLCAAKVTLEETLRSTNFPHEVANACLSYREGRIGVDLVHDDVEIQLKKVWLLLGTLWYLHNSCILYITGGGGDRRRAGNATAEHRPVHWADQVGIQTKRGVPQPPWFHLCKNNVYTCWSCIGCYAVCVHVMVNTIDSLHHVCAIPHKGYWRLSNISWKRISQTSSVPWTLMGLVYSWKLLLSNLVITRVLSKFHRSK